jgi:hypothetical protein
VARGDAELGIQLISEIVSVPGAELLGPLPGDLQAMTVILAGIVTTAREPDAARALLRFLTSPAAAAAIKAWSRETCEGLEWVDAVEKGLRRSPNSDSGDSGSHGVGGGDDGSAVRRSSKPVL